MRPVTNTIQENDLIENNKKKVLNGEIILTHCRGYDTILIFFRFEGFHEQDIRLLSRNYGFIGCCFLCKEPRIKIIDESPEGDNFDCLRPNRTSIYKIDRTYNITLIELHFDGWFESSIRL